MKNLLKNGTYKKQIKKIMQSGFLFEELRDKEILITGSTGLICSSIVDFLSYLNDVHDYNIRIFLAVRNKEEARERFLDDKNIYLIDYDSTLPIEFDINVDYIIHGGNNANPNKYFNEPVETINGNVFGISNLLNYAASHNTKRVLYISSSEVYGKRERIEPFIEEDYGFVDLLNPRSSYAMSKRLSETLCYCYKHEYGVDTVIVRPGHIYGPTAKESDMRISSLFPYKAAKGENLGMKSDGSQMRSYCYCLDCASAILTVLIHGVSGNAYNISNKESIISIKEFVDILSDFANVDVSFSKPTSNDMKMFNKMQNADLNANKLESLGWEAIFKPKDGIAATVEIIKSNLR